MMLGLQLVLAGLLVMNSLAARAVGQATSEPPLSDPIHTLAVSINGLECPPDPGDSSIAQQLLYAPICSLHACARADVQRSCQLNPVLGSEFKPCDQGLLLISTASVLEHMDNSNGVDSLYSKFCGKTPRSRHGKQGVPNSATASQQQKNISCAGPSALHVAVSCTLAELRAAVQTAAPLELQAWSQVTELSLSDSQAVDTTTELNSSVSGQGQHGEVTGIYDWQQAVEPQIQWGDTDANEVITIVELDINGTELYMTSATRQLVHKAGNTTKEQSASNMLNTSVSHSAIVQGVHEQDSKSEEARINPRRCDENWNLWLIRAAMVLLLIAMQGFLPLLAQCTGAHYVVRT